MHAMFSCAAWPWFTKCPVMESSPAAVVRCTRRQHSYVPGLVLLYDKKRLYREVAALHMQAGDYGSLIAACVQYGDAAAGASPRVSVQCFLQTLVVLCACVQIAARWLCCVRTC